MIKRKRFYVPYIPALLKTDMDGTADAALQRCTHLQSKPRLFCQKRIGRLLSNCSEDYKHGGTGIISPFHTHTRVRYSTRWDPTALEHAQKHYGIRSAALCDKHKTVSR